MKFVHNYVEHYMKMCTCNFYFFKDQIRYNDFMAAFIFLIPEFVNFFFICQSSGLTTIWSFSVKTNFYQSKKNRSLKNMKNSIWILLSNSIRFILNLHLQHKVFNFSLIFTLILLINQLTLPCHLLIYYYFLFLSLSICSFVSVSFWAFFSLK